MNEQSVAGLARILIESNTLREPDFIIGGQDNPYLKRWYLQKDADTSSIYLHQIIRDDDDRALHDHPWDSTSIVLSGVMREILQETNNNRVSQILEAGDIVARSAEDAHRLEVVSGPVWTLFITGQRKREWGFYCPQGWRHWKDFVDINNPGLSGPGCD